MKKFNKIISLLVLVFIPQIIFANAGTALMWMPIAQLIFGNILIGIVEGLIVSLIFKTKWYRSVLILILGNYASWIIGNGLILVFQNVLIDSVFKLNNVFTFWIISLFVLYILTVFIELPFYRWIFNKNNRIKYRSLKLSFILNIFTYTVMIFLYLSVSKYSFFTDLTTNQSLLENKTEFEIYFNHKSKIYKGKIADNVSYEKIYEFPDSIEYIQFYLDDNKYKESKDLYLLLNYFNKDTILFQNSFVSKEEKDFYFELKHKHSQYKIDFRKKENRTWDASARAWAFDGLTINDKNYDFFQNYAFEVPWMFWRISNVSILNNSELICNINGRIILINKDTKEIAFIIKGENYILKRK